MKVRPRQANSGCDATADSAVETNYAVSEIEFVDALHLHNCTWSFVGALKLMRLISLMLEHSNEVATWPHRSRASLDMPWQPVSSFKSSGHFSVLSSFHRQPYRDMLATEDRVLAQARNQGSRPSKGDAGQTAANSHDPIFPGAIKSLASHGFDLQLPP